MSVVAPKLFQSSDTGAPTLSGTVGDLTELLASCLVVRRVFNAVSGASFTDRTTEARLQGGSVFPMFPTPGTSDELYIGLTQKFERTTFILATPGLGGTYVFEYWSGAAWSAFTPTDGTSGFTVSPGALTWSIASLTGWVTNTVNSITCYWIRIRPTVLPSSMPTVNSISVTGWSVAYSGTNQMAFQMGAANQFYLNVNDNGPGAGGAREARIVGYETMSAIGTGTNPFPTAALYPNGLFMRKSTALSGVARSWLLITDDRTFYLCNIPADTGNHYTAIGFGDFYSFVASDGYRTMIMGRGLENTALSDSVYSYDFATRIDQGFGGMTIGQNVAMASNGKFMARNWLSAVGAARFGASVPTLCPALGATAGVNGWSRLAYAGRHTYPNPIDGGIFVVPVWMAEVVYSETVAADARYQGDLTSSFRGRLRGLWGWQHAYNVVADRTPFTGSGAMVGKSFIVLTPTERGDSPGGAGGLYNGTMTFETSDTWETNT